MMFAMPPVGSPVFFQTRGKEVVMRRFSLIAAVLCGFLWCAAVAMAENHNPSFKLLDNAQVVGTSSTSAVVRPVAIGWGWRGPGYYPGAFRPYGGYYGYYPPVYSGYYAPPVTTYYTPYYSSYYTPYYSVFP
jgi:hypothetical protein